MDLVRLLGVGNWTAIANEISGGRNSKQCRERWHNHLDPDVKKGPWTPDEDAIIIARQKTLGNQWARIAEHLVGRTDMAVKNRWHTFVRSAQRKGSDTIESTTLDEADDAAKKPRRGGRRTCGSRAAARRAREAVARAISSSSDDDHEGDDDADERGDRQQPLSGCDDNDVDMDGDDGFEPDQDAEANALAKRFYTRGILRSIRIS